MSENISVEVLSKYELARTDLEATIFELDQQIDMLSSHADKLDYFVAVASGLACGLMDVLWVGDFDLATGRDASSKGLEDIVERVARSQGYKGEGIQGAVKFLEDKFPIPSDGNTPQFGGGLQHHLRDFAHHPTIMGLIFSLLTQFTYYSYGTNKEGLFTVIPVADRSNAFIGETVGQKIVNGTVTWFFHLVSDMVGSSAAAGLSGGTGIPGPILSLVKELSVLPIFRDMKVRDIPISTFLSKMFNGTLFAQHDEYGKIIKGTEIKFDLRGELGALEQLGKQAVPVIANEMIVRTFYFIRRLGMELKANPIHTFTDLQNISWDNVKPYKNPTLTRMLTIATATFTAVDVTDALVEQNFLSVNYIGVGRFTIALGSEMVNYLKVRDVKRIKKMYEEINNQTYTQENNRKYNWMGSKFNLEKFGLNTNQTIILFNLQRQKVLNDIENDKKNGFSEDVITLKEKWIKLWKEYIEKGFSDFVGDPDAYMFWYPKNMLIPFIERNNPQEGMWFKLVMLEAMLFEPYYALSYEVDNKGNQIPSKEFDILKKWYANFDRNVGDEFLNNYFHKDYYDTDFVLRLRDSHKKIKNELTEKNKKRLLRAGTVLAAVAISYFSAGLFAPEIAVLLVGSEFSGLSGAALTSACLAYLGGGALAVGGAGMAGGTAAIVGGASILGLGSGTLVSKLLISSKEIEKETIKVLLAVKEIILQDLHDVEYAKEVYSQMIHNVSELEKELADLKETDANKAEIKNAKEVVKTMKKAAQMLEEYNNSYALMIV